MITRSAPQIIQIKLMTSNAYLVIDEQPILVDTGAAGNAERILKAMQQHGISPSDIKLILHTHAHGDHAGSTAALKQTINAPVMTHLADEAQLQAGINGTLLNARFTSALWKPLVAHPYQGIRSDLTLRTEQRLDAFGIRGQIIFTPGHTAGSISLVLDGGEAIVGDVLMGGFMGGNIAAGRPRLHYFAQDFVALQASMQRLLALPLQTLYVGHGGPVPAAAARRRFAIPAVVNVASNVGASS
jgi:glyoxylase-like metal-dependent hydrolase (beta-lactamase superfamily II)